VEAAAQGPPTAQNVRADTLQTRADSVRARILERVRDQSAPPPEPDTLAVDSVTGPGGAPLRVSPEPPAGPFTPGLTGPGGAQGREIPLPPAPTP
jgi:hypothetical protein